LTAVVLLPTPPAGSHGDDVADARDELHTALHGMRDDLHRHVHRHAADAGDTFQLRRGRPAYRLDLALGRVAQKDVDRDIVAVDLDVLRRLAADVILARVGIDELLERFLDLLLGDGHGMYLLGVKRRARF
jgi:hypothetical protein